MNNITCNLETVNREQAAIWLDNTERCGFINRPPSLAVVDKYAGDMSRGDWFVETGETIKLAKTADNVEYVVDGQHRLKAILQTRKPVDLWVFKHVPERAFQYIDQGKPRELRDIMVINNHGWSKEASILSSAGRFLWKEDKTGDAAKTPAGTDAESEGNIAEYLFTHYDDLPAALTEWKPFTAQIQQGGLGGHAWLLYPLYRWGKLDKAHALKVAKYLVYMGQMLYAAKLEIKSPSSKAARTIRNRFANGAPKPPSRVWAHAVDYVAMARKESEEVDAHGNRRVLKGANQDLRTATVRAYQFAWNCDRTGEKIMSRDAFRLALVDFVEDNGNIIGNAV